MPILWVARCRSARGMIEWLCTQERWNPEVAIMYGAVVIYRRKLEAVMMTRIRIIQCCIRGGFPHTCYLESPFFILSRTGHGSSQVFEMLSAFLAFRGRYLLVRGMTHPYFSVGPSRQREALVYCRDGLALLETHDASSPW
jgi:hypothetical protein